MDTAENLCETQSKLNKILWKLLEPNFKIKNGLYLNLLLTHWISKTENGLAKVNNSDELNETFFQWLLAAIRWWDKKLDIPPAPVLSFALNVGCHLSTNEHFFTRMNNVNVYEKLAELAKDNNDRDTSVAVGLITLLSSVLEHEKGAQWLVTTTYWNDIIDIGLTGNTKYIKQKAYKFVIKLLEVTVVLDKDFCEELVEILVEPLNLAVVELEYAKGSKDEYRKIYNNLKPALDLLTEISDALLKKFNNDVFKIFIETEIPETIQNILNFSQIQEFSFDLLKIRFVFLFYHLCIQLEMRINKATHDTDTLFYIGKMFDLIKAEIEKDHVICVIKICYYAHVLYTNLNTSVPLCVRKGEAIEFQNQMMLFQLLPIMSLGRKMHGIYRNKQIWMSDDLRQRFYLKLAKISAIKTLEITSRWEQRLTTKPDLLEDIIISLQYILKSRKMINKEQAAIIFQPLIYSLKDASLYMEMHPVPDNIIVLHHPQDSTAAYISLLIDLIIALVESFDLTWKDCLETMSVLDLACEFCQYDCTNCQVSVKLLQLLNIAIARCLSPNMVLLMINTTDTAISQIGSLLHKKCYDQNYHIRNQALEVVSTLAVNAGTKFSEFTDVLFNAELPELAVNMAVKDKEYEVRRTALKCLQALIRVRDIFEVYQYDYKFWDTIINILINEPKCKVRKEAVQLLNDIYKYKSFPEDILPRIYDIMTYAAVSDIHWEVKRTALDFWAFSIERQLQSQGMTDKTFPAHIFSKEKKKIVSMTKEEVKRRVIIALNQASDCGAMYVLKSALEDKFNEEISKFAIRVVNGMMKLYTAFKISWDDADLDQPSLVGNNNNGGKLKPASLAKTPSHSQPSVNGRSIEQSQSETTSNLDQQQLFSPADSGYPQSSTSSSVEPPDNQLNSMNNSPNSESQCLDSPSLSGFFDLPSYLSSPKGASLSSFDNGASLSPPSPNMNYSNVSSPDDANNIQNTQANALAEELQNVNDLDISCTQENDILDGDIDLEIVLAEISMDNLDTNTDIAETGKLFDELLKLSDATLIEEIGCDSTLKVKAPQIKTRQYVAPSEYARICFEVTKNNKKESTQFIHLDEFDGILNEILKEYDLVTL